MEPSAADVVSRNYMSILDWCLVVGYLVFVIYLGARLARRQTSSDHYFVADRKIPGWAAGVSMFATLLSSFTFIAFPGWTYERDWQLLMREGMAPLAVIFCAILIIPIYRQAIRMSAYEYLEKRFGYIGRLYGTVGFLLGHFVKTGVVLFALSLALSTITGVHILIIIVVLGCATILFTFLGGIEGVVWTDVVQGALMLLGGLITIAVLFGKTDVPFEALTTAWDGGKFKLIDPTFDLTQETFWVFAFFGIFHFLTKYSTDQTMVQRYLLAPSVKEAVKGSLIGLACCIAAWLIFFFIGSLLWGFYQVMPERLGAAITTGDEVFPYFIGRELPIGLTGLVLAGLFSSALSTMSSDLNCIGACVTSDFYQRFAKEPTDKAQLFVGKITVLVSGILMIGLAIAMNLYPGSIVEFTMDVAAIVGSIIAGGLLALFMLGFFTQRVSRGGMYCALVFSIVLTGLALLHLDGKTVTVIPGFHFHLWILPIITNAITMIVAYLTSLTIFRAPPADKMLTVYGYDIYPKIIRNLKVLVGIRSENNTKV